MAVQIISFYDGDSAKLYPRVWDYLREQYGDQINDDERGSCFRGKNGETAVLMSDLSKKNFNKMILINLPQETLEGLEKILGNNMHSKYEIENN